MQAKDVDEKAILRFLASQLDNCPNGNGWTTWIPGYPNSIAGQATSLDVPQKVLHAKLKAMVRRGIIDGCTCGCRGDFVITPKGRDLL